MTEWGPIARAACLAQVLSSPTRLKLLKLVETEELCVCELSVALGVSQPAVSQHLAKLRQAGLLTERRVGQLAIYGAADVATVFGEAMGFFLRQPASSLPELSDALARLPEAHERRLREHEQLSKAAQGVDG